MYVTVLADASHCPETKVGGYGYWIASNRGKKGGGGILKGLIHTSSLAEMMAIVNAIYIAIKHEMVMKGDKVLIQTDCQAAIDGLLFQRRLGDHESKTAKYFVDMTHTYSLAIEFRHVKGHTSIADKRSMANKTCDRYARQAMRKARILYQIKLLEQIVEGKTNETVS